jgi:hypothetical protein
MRIVNELSWAGCGCCAVNRRKFLAGCAACAAGLGGVAALSTRAVAQDKKTKPKVRLVYAFLPATGPIWPNIGYDFDKRMRQLTGMLNQACPDVELLPVVAQSRADARKILAAEDPVDGYLVYLIGLWTGASRTIIDSGRPVVLADDLFGGSGEFLIEFAAARRAGKKVAGVSSSRIDDVAQALRCFQILKQPGKTIDDFVAACDAARIKSTKPVGDMTSPDDPVKAIDPKDCLEKLRSSTVLIVGRDPGEEAKAIKDVFGTTVKPISFQELHQAYLDADHDQAVAWAQRWITEAEKVIEPTQEEIEKSGAMYLGMCDLMKRYNAQAITVNCLGGFYGGHLQAYPCLGFCQFNSDGLVGACESDLNSTMTMLTMGHLISRPGYISDPVIDTSKNRIIYAHCVASHKVFGPQGPSNPYHIRDHSEDRKGAAVRSLMPLGYTTTALKVDYFRREMVMHQGKSVENVDEDKACRTKLAVEVNGDIQKLLTMWDQWGWHRVTFYGELKDQVREVCQALGLKVVEEA